MSIAVPSFWETISPPAAPMPPLRGAARCDVAIVGGGLLGLSAALHLAAGGSAVRPLGAETAGFGASGRNTGFVVPSLKSTLGPDDVRVAIGEAHAERLIDLVGRSGRDLFDLIARHRISCSAERTGWMQPAHTPAIARLLEIRAREWQARGFGVRMLDAGETARRLGTPGYHGALFIPDGGQLNPLAYARGLAAAATAAGASLHGASAVRSIESGANGRWTLRIDGGALSADRVLLATNALVGDLVPAVRDAVIPVRVHQIATAPLPGAASGSILPDRTPASDTRRHTFAVRWSPDGRLLTGGLVVGGPGATARAARKFARRLETYFPEHAPYRTAHVWSGTIAMLPATLPALFSVAPGLDAVFGCNGRGVALTTALGRVVAEHLQGRIAASEMPLPFSSPQAVPWRRLAGIGPSLWLPWSEFRDRLDTGRTG